MSVATGKRVVSELTDRKRYADAILETGQPCVQAFLPEVFVQDGRS